MPRIEEAIVAGEGGLPKVTIATADGARAEIYLHGAHVTSWIPARGAERLFVSSRSEFTPGVAIRGGVPVIFPQFANEGPLPKHGFARTAQWELLSLSSGEIANAVFRMSSSPATEAIWPHAFTAELAVSVGGRSLDLELSIVNTGATPFAFTAALHTYLRVADCRQTVVRGLEGLTYRDSTAGGVRRRDTAERVAIADEVNRIYFDVPSPLTVEEPNRATTIDMDGFTDVVVWNPGPASAHTLSDMEPDGYLRMLCVEAAAIEPPVRLEQGGRWSGRQRLRAD
ncbi:MAG TPA: D-hexose-6-phosphate mutarotase [Gemmatimonadaceae bacterium]